MTKAVPRKTKSEAFDSREAARIAARRDGVPIGQWLSNVIAERAHELGVPVADVSHEDRVDALATRLAGVAESPMSVESSLEVPTGDSAKPASELRAAEGGLPSSQIRSDDTVAAIEREHLKETRGDARRGPTWDLGASGARHASMTSVQQWEADSLLDEALDRIERRSEAFGRRAMSERQQQTVAALSREVERLDREDADRVDTPRIAIDRHVGLGRLARREQVRPMNDAVGAVAARLEQLERRIAQRAPAAAFAPGAEGDRGDGLGRRSNSEIERIDRKLATILSRLDGSAEAPRATSRPLADRRSTQRAVADITRRQAALDTAEAERGALLREPSYASINAAERRPEPLGGTAVHREPVTKPVDFQEIQAAFASLADRLEARLGAAVREHLSGDDGARAAQALADSVSGIERRVTDLQNSSPDRHAFQDVASSLDRLRTDVASLAAALADVSAQRSVDSLEHALHHLGDRMDRSRTEGVSEAVLAPIERLGTELKDLIQATDAQARFDGLSEQLATLQARLVEQEAHHVGPADLAMLQDQTRSLRDLVEAAVAHFPRAETIEQHFARLAARIDSLADAAPRAAIHDLESSAAEIRAMLGGFSPAGFMQQLSDKLERVADRIETAEERLAIPAALFDDLTRRIEDTHASLSDQIAATRQEAPLVDLRPIEAMIGGLSGKVDGLRQTNGDVLALGGLVRGLAAQIEDAQLPNADGRILDGLESQVTLLAERLDRSDASLDAIASLERLVQDLFKEMADTREAVVQAAKRTDLGLPTGRVPDQPALAQISEELAAFRVAQQHSEGRVHATLVTLNETLERMVERLVRDTAGPRPTSDAALQPIPLKASEPAQPIAAEPKLTPVARIVSAPKTEIDLDEAFKALDAVRINPTAKLDAPAVEIGRASTNDKAADVSPLIAAARRAAQAAQASAVQSAAPTGLPASRRRSTTGKAASVAAPGLFKSFGQKRRPVLLGIAGVVLLIGALQLVRLNGAHEEAVSDIPTVVTEPAPAAQGKDQSALPATAPATESATADIAPKAEAKAIDPDVTKTIAPAPAATAPLKSDPALAGLPAGLRDMALGGDPAAQFEVGVRLAEGRGIARDQKAAASWFERAANQNLAPAQYRVGSLYEKGIGVPVDASAAMSWYEKAADQGNVRAMHNLAVMAAEGSGAKPDYVKATSWFNKAAAFGVRDSQFNLAILNARGLGQAQNLAQSYTWFAIAASQGDADAAKKRDDVAAKLDAKTLQSAKASADAFKAKVPDRAANEVTPPPGGWDSLAPKTAGATNSDLSKKVSM